MGFSPNPSGERTERALIGTSPAMRRLKDAVARAAAQGSHVLVCGEPGTGREMVARAIHEQLWDCTAPFVKIDCARSSVCDLAIELFGVPLGDGRRAERRTLEQIARGSRLYEALGGTIFFENLPELPSRLQASLARLLRDREAIRVDDREQIEFDARMIVAADTMPERPAEEGHLHPDLYQRLRACKIDVPPLRDRREDIPGLAVYFVDEICRRLKIPTKNVSLPAQQLLAALPWHGNAWELKSLVEGLVLRIRSNTITLGDVLSNVQLEGRARPFVTLRTLREARIHFEREYIAQVLEHHHGRVPNAAKALGIQRTNLYRKLRHLRFAPSNGRR
jgi:two-component system nitrogen regulation response regulator NtrX